MSVMLRTHWVTWPRSRSRRCRTSKVTYVAAWPTCAASYGVMPHVYIVTIGPGSNGTTSRRAVSYNRMLTPSSSAVEPQGAFVSRRGDIGAGRPEHLGHRPTRASEAKRVRTSQLDAREADARPRLVPHVELQEHRGDRLDGRGVGQGAGVERTQLRDEVDDLGRPLERRRVVRADQHVGVDRLVQVGEGAGGQVVEGGRHQRARGRALDVGGDRTPRRHERLELVPHLGERVRHRDDDLAGQPGRHRRHRRRGRVPRRGDDDHLRGGSPRIVARLQPEVEVRPPLCDRRARRLGPLLRPRPDDDLETGGSKPGGQTAPGGAGASEDTDVHLLNGSARATLAQAGGVGPSRYFGLATWSLASTVSLRKARTSSRRSSRSPDLIAAARAASPATPRRASPSAWRATCSGPSSSSRCTIPSTLTATRVWNWIRPSVAASTSRSRNSRTASTRPAADGMSCRSPLTRHPDTSGVHTPRIPWAMYSRQKRRGRSPQALRQELEQVPLVLAHAPADGGQLDRAHHAGCVRGGLHDAHDPPLEGPERLPPAERVAIDRSSARCLVRLDQLLVATEAADRPVHAESPRTRAQPPQVLHRVTQVGELPVEHRPNAFRPDDEVAVAKVTVDDRHPAGPWAVGRQPAERQLERRVGLAERVEHAAELLDLVLLDEAVDAFRRNGVEPGQDLTALAGQQRPGLGVGV